MKCPSLSQQLMWCVRIILSLKALNKGLREMEEALARHQPWRAEGTLNPNVIKTIDQCHFDIGESRAPESHKALEKLLEELEVMQRSLQKRRLPKLRTSGHTLRPRKGKILGHVFSNGQEHNLVYKPWQNTDMSDILEKLPTLQDGANPWISKLKELLVGTQPAMGEIKKTFS